MIPSAVSPMPIRRELAYLLAALVVGAFLRGYQFSQLGLSHFDEGVYAAGAGGWWFADPANAFFSPPIFPLLIGVAYEVFGGVVDSAALAVSFVFSLATVPLAWWIGRTWWDGRVGLLAGWLIAADGMQVAFGRVALTDA